MKPLRELAKKVRYAMPKTIRYHLIENGPNRSYVRWVFIFDRGGRRHFLMINPYTIEGRESRLTIRHYLLRKDIELGRIEATPLAAAHLTSPPQNFAFFDELITDPLQLGEPVAAFLEVHFHRIAVCSGASAHETMRIMGEYKAALSAHRENRKQNAINRRERLAQTRAAGFVAKVDLKDGRIVRLCPKWHHDLSVEALKSTYRIFRKSPRARRYTLVAIDGPLKGKRFAPPGFQQVYLSAQAPGQNLSTET